jgi:hypothetical protein
MYRKSHILPYTEIYNLAVVTIVGSHLSNESYAPIDYHTWDLLPLQQHLGEKPIALSTTLALGLVTYFLIREAERPLTVKAFLNQFNCPHGLR